MSVPSLSELLARYFFTVARVQPLTGATMVGVKESDEILRPYGLRINSPMLCRDLSLLALGSEVKNRYEVEAMVIYELSRRLPWWLKLIPGAEQMARERLLKAQMREWFILEVLQTLRLPGTTFRRRYLSIAMLYLGIKRAVYALEIPLDEVRSWLQRVTKLAQTVTENEQVLLEALPDDAQMAELPEMLRQQFVAERVDPEVFFSGDEYRAAFAIAKAVRLMKRVQSSSEAEQWKSHNLILERLLSHPGRAIILETSRSLEQFQAFVLLKMQEFIPHSNGDEVRMRNIDSPSEISRARTASLAMHSIHPPLFWKRVLNRSIDVREYGFIEYERPRSHLLIDKSPLMLFFGKLFKAGGVLFNRLLGSLNDSSDVVFQLFDAELHRKIAIDGPYEAQQVMSMIRMANFVGSGTDIDAALRATIAAVRKLPQRKTADHVVLVTDGNAKVTVRPEECTQIKLHCFLLGGSNPELKAISRATGGVYQEG